MDWLEHDEVPERDLPTWARAEGETFDGKPYRVVARPEGLVLRQGRTASAVPWRDVLVPIRLDDPRRLLVAAARRPPRTPWFELGGADVAAIERAVRMRLEALAHRGYRDKRPRRAIPPDEVLTEVLAKRPLPGAVEIPAATASVLRSALIGAAVGGVTLGFYGLVFGPVGLVTGGGVGAFGGAGLMGGLEQLRKRGAGRVLVLTPDAFVGGLDGESVRAVPWFRVGRFVDGVDDAGQSALEVYGHDHQLLARTAARWFGAPLDVIVAVAEAYRRRALEEL
ncbi:MAG TPA: hypothetical protein RMH99_08520 [Sandaracinaceae bacterium LLY-WYZ-13_1]|nr:hypothetical protein [Sandaracinaceae bacterium LLY-WYZ-13_1]